VPHATPEKALTSSGEIVLYRVLAEETLALHARSIASLAKYLHGQVSNGRLRKL